MAPVHELIINLFLKTFVVALRRNFLALDSIWAALEIAMCSRFIGEAGSGQTAIFCDSGNGRRRYSAGDGSKISCASAGEFIQLRLSDNVEDIRRGYVLSSIENPVPLVSEYERDIGINEGKLSIPNEVQNSLIGKDCPF